MRKLKFKKVEVKAEKKVEIEKKIEIEAFDFNQDGVIDEKDVEIVKKEVKKKKEKKSKK